MTETLSDLPTLAAFLKTEREEMREKLARLKKRAKLYLQLLRTLRKRGVLVEFSSYGALDGEVNIPLFEKDDNGRIKFTLDGSRLRPALRRTIVGTPVVAILGKVAGFRLSKAHYRYPRTTDTPGVYRCTGSVELTGKWEGLTVEFSTLFHDKEGQRCRVEKTVNTPPPFETFSIVCNAGQPVP